ncbi:hypothetical protein GQ600_19809 [Phytophthora cactorum]|nr:hypothetical protein GQ600_19809 [Phytophthora cactorum]
MYVSFFNWESLCKKSKRWMLPYSSLMRQTALDRALFEPSRVDASDIQGLCEQGAVAGALFELARVDASIAQGASTTTRLGGVVHADSSVDAVAFR